MSNSIPVEVNGSGTGFAQHVNVKDQPYSIDSDTYTELGGGNQNPSPVSLCLASLGTCTQVTGNLVAKDLGVKLGKWEVNVVGDLPTDVLVEGKEGNPNWNGVNLEVKIETDAKDEKEFEHFKAEVERRCPITALFQRSGVEWKSNWKNEPLKE